MVSMEVQEFRPSFGRGLAIAVAVIAALGFIISLFSATIASLRYLPVLALVVTLVWAAFWFPAVEVSPAGVTLKNIFRTIELPWPAIQAVDTRYALTLQTAYGQYSAWAAPAPGRAEVARQNRASGRLAGSANLPVGVAAASGTYSTGDLVKQRFREMHDAGFLTNAKLERDRPIITWHWNTIAALIILAVATALTFILW